MSVLDQLYLVKPTWTIDTACDGVRETNEEMVQFLSQTGAALTQQPLGVNVTDQNLVELTPQLFDFRQQNFKINFTMTVYSTLNEQLEEQLSQEVHMKYIPCQIAGMVEDVVAQKVYNYKIGIDTQLFIKTKTYSIQPECGYEDDFSIESVLPKGAPDETWQIDARSGILTVQTTFVDIAAIYQITVSNKLKDFPIYNQLLPFKQIFIVTLEDPNSFINQDIPYFDLNNVELEHQIRVGEAWEFQLPDRKHSKGFEVYIDTIDLG